jgi:gliding motility-associated-like protein
VSVSYNILISVSSAAAPAVSITMSPATIQCDNSNLIFTATPVSGGSAPVYQWQVNGVTVFSGSATWATASLNNGDLVKVIMTSNLTCIATTNAVSNIIQVNTIPVVAASVSISIPNSTFCQGTQVTFTANGVNAGSAPFYQWQVNGVNAGTNSSTYSVSNLQNGDKVRVLLTSNGNCVSPVNSTSNLITVTVLTVVNPSVSIVANPAGAICAGTNVSFSASGTSTGAAPVYQWYINGTAAGANSPNFSSASLNNGDIVKVSMTSNAFCPVPATVNSNQVVMQVNPLLTPSVTIATNAFPACQGAAVNFTSAAVNSGSAPVYQWFVNGIATGSNSSSLLLSTLNNGDSIKVKLTSNAICATPAVTYSNTLASDILPILAPAAAITLNPAGVVCNGDSIYVISNVQNGGSSANYQWLLNGNNTAGNVPVYGSVFADNDTIQLIITSSYQCAVPLTDTSNMLVTNIAPNLTPSVTISVNPQGAVCPGDQLIFTAAAVNGGSSPVYEWLVNGLPAGGNNSVFTSTALADGDVVRVRVTSSEMCVTNAIANSNSVVVDISPNIVPDVTIAVSPVNSVCVGDSLTFSSVYTGAGLTPGFNWRINGVATGINTPVFTTALLNNGDVIDVVLTSSAFCALPAKDTSNTLIALIDPLLTPVVYISANPPGTFCDGKEITYAAAGVNGGANPQYQWQLNNTNTGTANDTLISSAFADGDTLAVIYTSSEKCLAINPVISNLLIIDRLPPIDPSISSPDELCEGTEVTVIASATGGNGGPYYFEWNNNLGTAASLSFVPPATNVYTVTVSDSCSTSRSVSKSIIVNPLPDPAFSAEPATATILNPGINFTDLSINASSWIWNFGDGATSMVQHSQHTYLLPGIFTVQLIATSDKGCIDSTYSELLVENVVTFYIPNSFTPNGDGNNDNFGVTGYSVQGYNLAVYNRWGQIVFQSSGLHDSWNGQDSNGKPVPSGVYVYQLQVLNDPHNKIRTGTVTLIR